ncbi:nucleotidyltransferase family protein [Agaribacter flavus]|uniref:NTP transferase domain-containing protein n=1 Tax=Agaribacter flavus TaxID=1902781 RepID=A0ABV7FQW4_9ALTE
MKLHVIILAAGRASRFGSPKQLASIGNKSLINHCIDAYLAIQPQTLTVVTGCNSDEITHQLPPQARALYCPSWEEGMGTSLSFAINNLPKPPGHVLIGLGDQIAITQDDLSGLINLSMQHPEHIISARYKGTLGVPALFPEKCIEQLSELSGDTGAKHLINSNQYPVIGLSMPNGAFDIDSQDDLANWHRRCTQETTVDD